VLRESENTEDQRETNKARKLSHFSLWSDVSRAGFPLESAVDPSIHPSTFPRASVFAERGVSSKRGADAWIGRAAQPRLAKQNPWAASARSQPAAGGRGRSSPLETGVSRSGLTARLDWRSDVAK
jgi:hypothetical protein